MPQTTKGKKIMSAMKKQYGSKKAKQVYYASIVKGKIKGAEGKGGTGKLEKAKKTYAKKSKGKKKFSAAAFENAKKSHYKLS